MHVHLHSIHESAYNLHPMHFIIQVGMGLDPNNVWEYEPEVESDAE